MGGSLKTHQRILVLLLAGALVSCFPAGCSEPEPPSLEAGTAWSLSDHGAGIRPVKARAPKGWVGPLLAVACNGENRDPFKIIVAWGGLAGNGRRTVRYRVDRRPEVQDDRWVARGGVTDASAKAESVLASALLRGTKIRVSMVPDGAGEEVDLMFSPPGPIGPVVERCPELVAASVFAYDREVGGLRVGVGAHDKDGRAAKSHLVMVAPAFLGPGDWSAKEWLRRGALFPQQMGPGCRSERATTFAIETICQGVLNEGDYVVRIEGDYSESLDLRDRGKRQFVGMVDAHVRRGETTFVKAYSLDLQDIQMETLPDLPWIPKSGG